jgi:glycosyltransferase involved in cell wall biosynthesis
MHNEYKFTVFTPTFNRIHTLPRVYKSLVEQTFKDFEWVVVDDGSTDGTREYITDLAGTAAFPIRYFYQPNGGKHRAHNRGVMEARGELFAILDSDDWYESDALERFWFHWTNIPEKDRPMFNGVTALIADNDGNIIGSRFPKDIIDSDAIDIRSVHGVTGDKRGVICTHILRNNPYPEIDGEKFVPDALVWNRIARQYQTRFINEILSYSEYLGGGYTAFSARIRILSPIGSSLYYQEFVNHNTDLSLGIAIRNYANYIRFTLHGKARLSKSLKKVHSKRLFLLSVPLGTFLWLKDKKVPV